MGKLAFSLFIFFASISQPVIASENGGSEKTYFVEICEELLKGLSAGEVEAHFLSQAKTPDSMTQLLKHYQIIYHPDFAKALLPALQDLGMSIENLTSPDSEELTAEVKKVMEFLDRDSQKLTDTFLDNMVQLKSVEGSGRTLNQAKVETLRVSRLVQAINGDQHSKVVFRKILLDLTKSTITKFLAIRIQQLRDSMSLKPGFLESDTPNSQMLSLIVGCGVGVTSGNIVYGILSFFASYVCLAGANYQFEMVQDKARLSKMLQLSEDFKGTPYDVNSHHVASANSVLFRPLTAIHEIKQVSESGVLSILKMCGNDVCSANPVEIAYLGFTDLLEVRALESALRAEVARENESQKREMVLSIARQLLAQPEQFGLQAKLRREWSGWITDLKQRSELRISLAEDLSRKVSELASEVKRLQKMVLTSDLQKKSDEDLRKYEMFLEKVNGDLATILRMGSKVEDIRNWSRQLHIKIGKVEALGRDLPEDGRGWAKRAEEIIQELESW